MIAYKAYHVKRSAKGAIVGAFNIITNISLMGWMRDNIPLVTLVTQNPDGKLDITPADFLINEEGIIIDLF